MLKDPDRDVRSVFEFADARPAALCLQEGVGKQEALC
jgi:hypothetical protein